MDTKQAIEYFGSRSKLARALGIKSNSTYDWREKPPYMRQHQLEKLTKGKLKAELPEIPA